LQHFDADAASGDCVVKESAQTCDVADDLVDIVDDKDG
jgi:hypothetical protein